MFGRVLGTLLVVGSLMLCGCSSLTIEYRPAHAPPPAARARVALEVHDTRAENRGRGDERLVGRTRSTLGIPSAKRDAVGGAVTRTVGAAITDALQLAGVEVSDGQPRLVADVTDYWMDGYMGYSARVKVRCVLLDWHNKPLWSAEAEGKAGGAQGFIESEDDLTERLFEEALGRLAVTASERFAAADFRSAVGL